jgi:hypothetical protein
MSDAWLQELEHPTPAFFGAFAERAAGPSGPREATKDAVRNLTPAVDWAAYLPHIPHGLLGLGAIHRLRPLLKERSFLRALATQIHAFAHEGRSAEGHGLGALGLGSGSWDNLTMALETRRPSIAWGEAAAVEAVAYEQFLRLERAVEKDMANVGHKAVMARHLGDLFRLLEEPRAGGRMLLGLCAWLSASEPFDTFWHDRAARRLEGAAPPPAREATATPAELEAGVREICDSGLVELLDRFSARIRAGEGTGDLLAQLVLAASEKQLDARRDLEGKTSWNFVYLARLARAEAPSPEAWAQAAALVNLFPTDEAEDRPRPAAPRSPAGEPAAAMLDAILDAEPLQAMFHAQVLLDSGEEEAVLRILAEAATVNDPGFNHSHQLLAVAAAADLAPLLGPGPRRAMALALAKSLANSQGSSDAGRLAEEGLGPS